jgi:hypothetical protein
MTMKQNYILPRIQFLKSIAATGLGFALLFAPVLASSHESRLAKTHARILTNDDKDLAFGVNTKMLNPPPAADAGSNQSVCMGSGATIGAAPVTGSVYTWTPAAGLSSTTSSQPFASPAATTTYTLTETNGGMSASNTVTVTVNPLPAAGTGPNQTICNGTSTTIGVAAVAGDTYAWTPITNLS